MADGLAWDIVRRAADGDAGARRRLVEATLDNLWALAIRLTRRRDEADDVVQETYARMFAALPGLEPIGRFEGYLARIATNIVLQRWRRQRPSTAVTDGVIPPDALEPWQAVADQEEDRRRLAAIWTAIGRLPAEQRAAVLLFYAQGESCEGIARTLDVPVGTVKTWLHRARNQVRQAADVLLRGEPALNRAESEDLS